MGNKNAVIDNDNLANEKNDKFEDPNIISENIKLQEDLLLIKHKIEIDIHEKALKKLELEIQNNESFLNELSNFYDNPEEIINELTPKYTNKNIFLIENEDTKALIFSILKEEIDLAGSNSTKQTNNIETLTANSENLWKNFVIEKKIDENNYEEYMTTLLNNLNDIKEKIDNKFGENLNTKYKDYIMSKDLPIEENILRFIKWYSTNDYKLINRCLCNLLSVIKIKISYLFNLLILNFQKHLVGLEYEGTVYKALYMNEDYLKIHKINSIIIYTSLTVASKNENIAIKLIPQVSFNRKKVLLIFKLLPISIQEKRKFYSSLDIEKISYYGEKQKEVIIFPFQFFKILSKIEEKDLLIINLEQLPENNIIEQILARGQENIEFKTKKNLQNSEESIENLKKKIFRVLKKSNTQIELEKYTIIKKFENQNLNYNNSNDPVFAIKSESDIIKIHNHLEEKDQNIHVLWVGNDFEKTSDDASFIRQFELKYNKIEFISKTSTEEALNFLKSDDGNKLRNKKFKIITNMIRPKEQNPENAGIRLIQGVRMLFFRCPILIFIGNIEKSLIQLENEKVYDNLSWMTTKIAHLENFIINPEI